MRSLAIGFALCLFIPAIGATAERSLPPLNQFLSADGTIRLDSGYVGSVDIGGYELRSGADGAPKFVAKSAAKSTQDPGVWKPFGGLPNGCNGAVTAISPMPTGEDIAFAGAFSVCGGTAVENFALFRPSTNSWRALREGLPSAARDLQIVGGELYAAAGAGIFRLNSVSRTWTQIGAVDGGCSVLAEFNGQLHVGGIFSSVNGIAANSVARWDLNAWSALGAGIPGFASVFAMSAADTVLYVGGDFDFAGATPANNVAFWTGSSWGRLGSGSANGVDSNVFDLANIGGEVFVGGLFNTAGNLPASKIARWNGAWNTLGLAAANGLDASPQVLFASGNDVFVGGFFSLAGGIAASRIARWNHPTQSWNPVGNGANRAVRALSQSGSFLYAGGDFDRSGAVAANAAMRWNGSAWSALGNGTGLGVNGPVRALALGLGVVYVGGSFSRVGNVDANNIARWNGTEWAAMGTGTAGSVYAIAVTGSFASTVYVGGGFDKAGDTVVNGIARWNGSSWNSLGNGVNGDVLAIEATASDVFVGGAFGLADGLAAKNVARWNGSNWSSLGSGAANGVSGGIVRALKIADSQLYVGGSFSSAGGLPASRIARWNGFSGWAAVGGGVTGDAVYTIAALGSDIYVGGTFTSAGAVAASNVAHWDGSTWSALGSGLDTAGNPASVRSLAVHNGQIFAGGGFTHAGATLVNHAARWDGSSWRAMGRSPNVGAIGHTPLISEAPPLVPIVAILPMGQSLFVGGTLGAVGGEASSGVAIWTPDVLFADGLE